MFVAQNKRNLQKTRLLILTSLLLYIFVACAKIGSPLGGAVDEDPPVVKKTKPSNASINFVPKKNIEIIFDEFIQLEDIYQELIISPPLKENPIAHLKGKSVIVNFSDDAVFDTTTYTISFGNAIVDNNEGNILHNYEFTFSLNDYIDSMNVEGRVVNSFNHLPDEERMHVMLYKNLNDSAPLLEYPSYICRTDDKGYFSLHNLESGDYRLFALKDVNANLLFDIPEEQIAFHDSIIELNSERFENDIIIQDASILTLINQQDSVLADTALYDSLSRQARMYSFHTEMVFFTQQINNQYMLDYLRKQNELLFFSFNEGLKDTFHINPINFQPLESWYLLDANENNDTLAFWITDTTVIRMDSLEFEVIYPVYDSLGAIIAFTDTLLFISQNKEKKSKRTRKKKKKDDDANKKTDKAENVKKLPLYNNIKNAKAFDLNKRLSIITNTPCFNFNTEKFQFYLLEDTLEIPQVFNVQRDTNSYYRFFIDYQLEELTSYKVVILDSALLDIYGASNDTTELKFKTQAEDYYGILSLNLSKVNDPVILQLLDENENLISEKFLESDQNIRYEYLTPKKYLLKIIIDSNNNGKWDTGHYLQKLQPEKIIYYEKAVNVRSNWEVVFNWELKY